MKKIIKISYCAECPFYEFMQTLKIPFCKKMSRRVDEDSENSVNPALCGFSKWCPLETLKSKEVLIDFKDDLKKIMEIIGDGTDPATFVEASHYLNDVVTNAITASS